MAIRRGITASDADPRPSGPGDDRRHRQPADRQVGRHRQPCPPGAQAHALEHAEAAGEVHLAAGEQQGQRQAHRHESQEIDDERRPGRAAAAEAEAKGESPIALSPAAPAEVPVKAAKKPKEAKKAAPVAEVAAPVAEVAAPAAEQEAEALPFKLGGATYIRMGISKPDGNHEWLSGDLWLSKKGARGSHAGELMEDGSINADAEEPTLS